MACNRGWLSAAEIDALNKVWHRLKPWPDSVAGLTRLKKKYIIAPLSNGNVALLTDMAKQSGLPWDLILGAELARHYKPDRETYLTAVDLLGLKPSEVMMAAAHSGDLRAAASFGLRTGFIYRPNERGPGGKAGAPVDWKALHFVPAADKRYGIVLELTRDQVKPAPEYKESKPIVVLGASGNLETLP